MTQENRERILKDGSYPVLPLRDIVVFPHMVVPLFVGRDRTVKAVKATGPSRHAVLLTQKDPLLSDPDVSALFAVGTLGTVVQVLTLADGKIKTLVRGERRVVVEVSGDKEDFFTAKIAPFEEVVEAESIIEPLRRTLLSEFQSYASLGRKNPNDLIASLNQISDPVHLVDAVAGNVSLRNLKLMQNLLETSSLAKRMELLIGYINSEVEMHQAEQRIKSRIKNQVERNHREYILNEQMKAIQRELGDGDEGREELAVFEEQIKTVKLPKEARERADSEIKKLKNMNPMAAEAAVIRNYLETLLGLPWGKHTHLRRDLGKAEAVLNQDHYGLKKIKERILEYLAVSARVDKVKGPVLCLVGPPGVGKTSLGKSIAAATGRTYVRVALGGVQDEAEIRGHRRTYIGSMPGKLLSALKKANTSNPLILLDEIDKLGSSWRKDPVSALLEVLDPEQNEQFQDHYLELGFDLSHVMFVTTANSMQMHPALLDRMEVVSLSGYTEDEKVHIAQKHLIPRQKKASGLKVSEFSVSEGAIRTLLRGYCKEAGVRNLDRSIATLARKSVRLLDKKTKRKKGARAERCKAVHITAQNLKKYAGVPRFHEDEKALENLVGITKGLAWTEVGGELLRIEALMLPGKGKMTSTGKLGEVMQESIQAASSFVRARAVAYGVKPSLFETRDIHVHVPEGATPKDGPSAGVAMCTSIVSVLTGIPVRGDVAMTGEISLRGRVLPIGGVKEKLLAAHRHAIKTVFIPRDNVRDLEDIPANVKRGLTIVPVATVDEVLSQALMKPLTPVVWTKEDQRLLDQRLSGMPVPVSPPLSPPMLPH